MNELANCLQKQIAESHQRCVDLSKQLEEVMYSQLEAMRETGVLLGKARQDLSSAEFNEMRDAIGLDIAAVKNYMSFAASHSAPVTELPEAIRCMRQTLRTTGLLQSTPGNPGNSPVQLTSETNFWSAAAICVRNFIFHWKYFLSGGRELSESEKDQLLGVLSPIIQIVQTLR